MGTLKALLRLWSRRRLRTLRRNEHPAAKRIARAIDNALTRTLTAEEKRWVTRIEELRKSLRASTESVTLTDYGAGDPDAARSVDEMRAGVVTSATVSEVCGYSKSPFWSLLLFKLIREFRPAVAIELGTSLGLSAAYQAAALRLNGRGRLTTLEGAATLADLARENLESLDLDSVSVVSGRFQDNLDSVLTANAPADYVFIDGHHDERATIAYFEQAVPHLAPSAVVVFDDIAWSAGMQRAWNQIADREDVALSVNLQLMGICVYQRDTIGKSSFDIPLGWAN